MSDLIQKAIEQTERAKYGVSCAEAVKALDITNKCIAEVRALVERVRNRPQRRGTDYLQGLVDGERRVVNELDALIERMTG